MSIVCAWLVFFFFLLSGVVCACVFLLLFIFCFIASIASTVFNAMIGFSKIWKTKVPTQKGWKSYCHCSKQFQGNLNFEKFYRICFIWHVWIRQSFIKYRHCNNILTPHSLTAVFVCTWYICPSLRTIFQINIFLFVSHPIFALFGWNFAPFHFVI